jgi:hypothetical protein
VVIPHDIIPTYMLGLSPAEVTKATDLLQKAGLIYYHAGEITVLDRPGVEKQSCECVDSGY